MFHGDEVSPDVAELMHVDDLRLALEVTNPSACGLCGFAAGLNKFIAKKLSHFDSTLLTSALNLSH